MDGLTKHQRYYGRHREEAKASVLRWRARHPDKWREIQKNGRRLPSFKAKVRRRREKLKRLWASDRTRTFQERLELGKRAEAMAAQILRAEGFGVVDHLGGNWFCDYIAVSDGGNYAVFVTASRWRAVHKKVRLIVNTFDVPVLGLFLHPNLDRYVLKFYDDGVGASMRLTVGDIEGAKPWTSSTS